MKNIHTYIIKYQNSWKSLILAWFVCLAFSCNEDPGYISPGPPQVTGISPESGTAGISMYIYGENFYPSVKGNSVRIGNTGLDIFRADSNQLIVIIPAGLESGNVEVTVNERSVTGPVFTYLPTVTVYSWSGSGLLGLQDGSPEEARFNSPRGLCSDKEGNIYVADQNNHAIRKIFPDGNVITLAGNGKAGYADGTGSSALFNHPAAITAGPDGNLYVADYSNNMIRKVSSAGEVSTLAGITQAGNQDGSGSSARFNRPAGIVSDKSGLLYVADFFNHTIRTVTTEGVVATWAGTGTPGYADGPRLEATFSGPNALALDDSGILYIGDWFNYRVRMIGNDGLVKTLAGSGQGYRDGTGSEAMFNTPVGLRVGPDNYVYVADGFNHRIRKIEPSGKVSTLAGSGEQGYRNGEGDHAKFNGPVDIVSGLEPSVLYVAGWYNHRIRKITLE